MEQITMNKVDEANAQAKNRHDRAKFKTEWLRLSMPGEVLDTTIDNLPVCGRFATVLESSGNRVEYELATALHVLRDYGDGDGATSRHVALMVALREVNAIV